MPPKTLNFYNDLLCGKHNINSIKRPILSLSIMNSIPMLKQSKHLPHFYSKIK